MDLLSELNPMQREAVCCTEGPLLILAGAGSGKTRVIAYRTAYLIREKGVPPHNILAVTFTNKAAREMQARVESLAAPLGGSVWVSTFHSLCARLLRADGERVGLGRRFTILDEGEQLAVMRQALARNNINERQFTPSGVLAAVSAAKNELVDLEHYRRSATSFWERNVARAFETYEEILRGSGAVDFDDLLVFACRLFAENPDVLDRYHQRFRYIMVDEYQDTNHAQYVLVRQLGAEHRNVCVVGDDDQSIYRWRGADVRNILSFELDYPEARVVKLEQNYRSTMAVLRAANSIISKNIGRKPKTLWTANPEGEPIGVYEAENERDEAAFVASEIEDLRATEGYDYRDFVILYRTNAQSRVLEETLLGRAIPYKVVGGMRFYERKEVKDVLAYLKLAANPDDAVSLRRVINTPKRGIGPATVERLLAFAEKKMRDAALEGKEPVTLLKALRSAGAEAERIGPKIATQLDAFLDFVERLREDAPRVALTDLTSRVINEGGMAAEFQASGSIEDEARVENLNELLSVTRDFEARTGTNDLQAFLEEVALVSDVDAFDERQEGVTLMTLHMVKGLEFPVVFIVGLEEGIFPHSRALLDIDELEEERRLCYVGVTRSQKRLYMCYARHRLLFGLVSTCIPSRFLSEVPRELVVDAMSARGDRRLRLAGFGAGGVSGGGAGVGVPRAAAAADAAVRVGSDLAPGDKVVHDKFGSGTVVAVEGGGADAVVTVAFPGKGVKRLLLSLAPLARVGGEAASRGR